MKVEASCCSSADLEATRPERLEHQLAVVFARTVKEPPLVRSAVANRDALEAGDVAQVVEGVVKTSGLGGGLDRGCGVAAPCDDGSIDARRAVELLQHHGAGQVRAHGLGIDTPVRCCRGSGAPMPPARRRRWATS